MTSDEQPPKEAEAAEAPVDQAVDEPEPEPVDAPGSAVAAEPGPVTGPASSAVIPPPKLERAGPGRFNVAAFLAITTFVLVGGLLVFGFAQALVPAAKAQIGAACRPLTPIAKAGPIPELELEDLDGNPVSLADFRGKYLIVNFWATWCDPCTREWPDLDILADRMSEQDDIAVIAISVDQEPEAIGPYLERMGLSDTRVTILRAKPPDAQKLFGSEMIPDTYFVNREGEFEAVFVNIRAWGKAKAVRCVEASAND